MHYKHKMHKQQQQRSDTERERELRPSDKIVTGL